MDTAVLIIGIVLWVISKGLEFIPFLPPPFSIALMLANMIVPIVAYIFIAWGMWRLVKSLVKTSKFTEVVQETDKEEK